MGRTGEFDLMAALTVRRVMKSYRLVLCCIEHESGGAYQAVLYAGQQQCEIINLAEKQMQT
jgi:hypothetical protein